MYMNIYISKENEKWLRMQGTSMSGIINKFLDEARAGKRGLHVIAQYETLEEAQESSDIRPVIKKSPSASAVTTEALPNVQVAEKLRADTGAGVVIPKSSLRPVAGFCKNGHSIPVGRGKCMGKGCKYA